MIISSEGIVLKQRKISNNRRILVLFTRNYGKISAGTSLNERGKSKSALALRPFTYAEYELFKTRETYNINSAQVKKSFYSIGEDLERFSVASKLIEYLDGILEEEQKRPKLFDLSIQFLESISKKNSNYDTLFFAFLVKTLQFQGVLPELEKCTCCGRSIENFSNYAEYNSFSVSDGGVVCKECIENKRISSNKLIFTSNFDIINTLKYFKNTPLQQFEKIDLKKNNSETINDILNAYIDYYIGFNFNNIKWR